MLRGILPEKFYIIIKYYYKRNQKHLSQIGQDCWVFGEVFNQKKTGYFVEIGSADGVTLNNTFLLETRYKWKGICIEADPNSFRLLKQFRKAICLNLCIDEQEGEVEFNALGLLGGIISDEMDNMPTSDKTEVGRDLKIITLKTKPLASVLREYNAPRTIDYLSIDCEGAEERILKKFPFDEYKFICITIERPSELLRDIFKKNQYIIIKEIPGLDVYYLHKDFEFAYHKNAVDWWQL
jgi:FkbM family methyltransferase